VGAERKSRRAYRACAPGANNATIRLPAFTEEASMDLLSKIHLAAGAHLLACLAACGGARHAAVSEGAAPIRAVTPDARASEAAVEPYAGKMVYVIVALCDNVNQGIVPVAPALGNGDDPARRRLTTPTRAAASTPRAHCSPAGGSELRGGVVCWLRAQLNVVGLDLRVERRGVHP
jgi:hypothetical protein